MVDIIVHKLFIHFHKAFNTIDRTAVLRKIWYDGILGEVVNVIGNLCHNTVWHGIYSTDLSPFLCQNNWKSKKLSPLAVDLPFNKLHHE